MTGLGVGPRVVDQMDCREINDLMAYWKDHSPPHIAMHRVFLALGGRVTSAAEPMVPGTTSRITTPEQLVAELGMSLEVAHGNG